MFDLIKQFASENKMNLLDSLPTWWDRYWDGIWSVTALLKLFQEPGFEYVKRNYADEVAVACKRWTDIHQWAEDFFSWLSEDIHKQILKFHVLYDFKISAQEQRVFKDISGGIDVIGSSPLLSWGVLVNVDYKTNIKQNIKYKIQMWWYNYLNWNPGYILYMSDKKFELVEVEMDIYLPLFLELKEYFFYLLNSQA
jgi:hypothetical protein